jgi:hypothetical protein
MISLKQLEADAIKVLRSFEPNEGYYLGYSGGKDATAESVMRWWLEDEIDETWVSMFEEEML